jgi:coenzyme F420-reducing hydrogenase alpha subunit
MASKTIRIEALTRVEGEGAVRLTLRDGRISRAQLRIFEPPRLFEALLRGRSYTEAADITARICGICPVAYQMSAVHAMESALGLQLSAPVRALRRLLYCGEWIESHALHITLLHAPDFLGYASGIEMAREHGDAVRRGLTLKQTGNELVALLGGREVHPVTVRVGGFYRVPSRAQLLALTERLERAREAALATVRWTAQFDFPACDRDYTFLALRHPTEYPFNEGRIVSNRGLDIAPADFEAHVEELQVKHSTALHAQLRAGGAYLTGPLARYNLNFERLAPIAREAALEAGLTRHCTNPFRSIVVRAVEVLHACDEALRIIERYEPPDAADGEYAPRAAMAIAATEAPRGLLYHRYRLAADGTITEARIVPPTSQNQAAIEEDLLRFTAEYLEQPQERLRERCERLVRNHDPCISCATHFLRLEVTGR